MKINLLLFITSTNEENPNKAIVLMKTFESAIRPIKGDIIDDPGFDPGFHNGYEVVKVTVNYALNTCYVSLNPLLIEREDIEVDRYVEKLQANDWRVLSEDDLKPLIVK